MKTAIKRRIAIEAPSMEIDDYLHEIMDEIKIKGEILELISSPLFVRTTFVNSKSA